MNVPIAYNPNQFMDSVYVDLNTISVQQPQKKKINSNLVLLSLISFLLLVILILIVSKEIHQIGKII